VLPASGSRRSKRRTSKRSSTSAEAERKLAQQRAQDEALQAFLDQMGQLLLEKDLRTSEEGSAVRTLAKARTVTALHVAVLDRYALG
jgi:hypothetical protein